MSNLTNTQFITQAQLKQVMLANSEKADLKYAKNADMSDYAKATDLGALASLDEVTDEQLSAALAATIQDKYSKAETYSKDEADTAIADAIGDLGALASLDVVAEDQLSDGLKNKLANFYTKDETYSRDETYTKEEVNTAISNRLASTYHAGGSCAFDDLPELSASISGYVYNVTDAFTPDERFVEGAFEEGQTVPAGTNVVVVAAEEDNQQVYKFDILSGFVDLSEYVRFDDINVASQAQIQDIIDSLYPGIDTDSDPEVVNFVFSSSSSLAEIKNFFDADPNVTTINAKLADDIVVPARSDGKISTTFVPAGKTVNLDLNGHDINCEAYALYVNGGTLIINDDTGNGKIVTRALNKAYPAIQVNTGKVVMNGGVIDCDAIDIPEGSNNYMYGVVCSGDGVFEMNGGTIKTKEAAGISITNGTAAGQGARFIIGGNSQLISHEGAAIYLADNKSVIVKDNAYIEGGIIARMGDIQVRDNARVVNKFATEDVFPFGEYLLLSGTASTTAGIMALTGCYNSNTDSNDLDITVAATAVVSSAAGEAIGIAKLNTLYDQKVTVTVPNSNALIAKEGSPKVKVYEHSELADICTAAGKTLKPEAFSTDLTVTVDGIITYPTE